MARRSQFPREHKPVRPPPKTAFDQQYITPNLFERTYAMFDNEVRSLLIGSRVLERAFAKIQEIIAEDSEAASSFKTLCEVGCDKDELLWLILGCLFPPGYKSAEDVLGLSSPKLAATAKRIESCAGNIQTINENSIFGRFLRVSIDSRLVSLPSDLRTYSSLLREAARSFGHRTHSFLNIYKARMVDHVRHATGKFHDREIAALVAVITDKPGYAALEHGKWRQQHYARLERIDVLAPLPATERNARLHGLRKMLERHPDLMAPVRSAQVRVEEFLRAWLTPGNRK
jgi:hypothetical protein